MVVWDGLISVHFNQTLNFLGVFVPTMALQSGLWVCNLDSGFPAIWIESMTNLIKMEPLR